MNRTLSLPTPHGRLHGELELPEGAHGLVLLVRARPQAPEGLWAGGLVDRGFAVLHFALLAGQEAQFPDAAHNIPKLTQRLLDILELVRDDGDLYDLPLALFAIGDATPAAIRAAARRDAQVRALACRGGLADRARIESLEALAAPLWLLVDAEDEASRLAGERASRHLRNEYRIEETPPGDPAPLLSGWLLRVFSG